MTNSLMQWHLARDNQVKLHKFCEKHRTTQEVVYKDDKVFHIKYDFDNDSFITTELLCGTKDKSYTVADSFQVVDYNWGTKCINSIH